jgi:hypothetical protein
MEVPKKATAHCSIQIKAAGFRIKPLIHAPAQWFHRQCPNQKKVFRTLTYFDRRKQFLAKHVKAHSGPVLHARRFAC